MFLHAQLCRPVRPSGGCSRQAPPAPLPPSLPLCGRAAAPLVRAVVPRSFAFSAGGRVAAAGAAASPASVAASPTVSGSSADAGRAMPRQRTSDDHHRCRTHMHRQVHSRAAVALSGAAAASAAVACACGRQCQRPGVGCSSSSKWQWCSAVQQTSLSSYGIHVDLYRRWFGVPAYVRFAHLGPLRC